MPDRNPTQFMFRSSTFAFKGEFTSGQERFLTLIDLIWFGYIARYPHGDEGGIFLVQMSSACFCWV